MKRNPFVSSSSRKSRKAFFNAPSNVRRKMMSSPLAKDLRTKYGIRSLPIRRDDEVVIVRGHFKGNTGRVLRVCRRKFFLHVDKITREKVNGALIHVPINPSKVQIVKLKLDKDRRTLIDRKFAGRAHITGTLKGKYTEEAIAEDS